MAVNESGLQKQIVKAVHERYPSAWIFHPVGSPYQETGVPDLLMVVETVFIGAEIKFIRPGESHEHAMSRVTKRQRIQIARINDAGGMAGAVTSVEETLDLIERGLKHRRRQQ